MKNKVIILSLVSMLVLTVACSLEEDITKTNTTIGNEGQKGRGTIHISKDKAIQDFKEKNSEIRGKIEEMKNIEESANHVVISTIQTDEYLDKLEAQEDEMRELAKDIEEKIKSHQESQKKE